MFETNTCIVPVAMESYFWQPEYLDVSAWTEHIPFAFWVVEAAKPKVIVELGVHNGLSYFSFCQAVERLQTGTTCYGIDTWKGDEHAGFYNDETYKKVNAYNTEKYARFSSLVPCTFDEAKHYFVDGSIDLLHIDGLHTYDAVKHDFENWLPKLSANAIVLLHDINVRERNFGVFRFWEELKQQYQHFQFDFCNGLGVVSINNNFNETLSLLTTEQDENQYSFLSNFFAERGRFIKQKFDHTRVTGHLLEKVNQLEKSITQSNESKAVLESRIDQLTERYSKLSGVTKNQKLHLAWYKATFEDRSIAGVIKQKLSTGFQSKARVNYQYQLTPEHSEGGAIKLVDGNMYEAYGTDPRFRVNLNGTVLKAGWHWLSLDVKEIKGALINPKLYYDCGQGFNERDIWNLPHPTDGKIACLMHFPGDVSALRIDPTTAKCTFSIGKLQLQPAGMLKVLQVALTKYKALHLPDSSLSSYYKTLLKSAFNDGPLRLKEKLKAAVYHTETNADTQYKRWHKLYDTIAPEHIKTIERKAARLQYQPLLSVVMPVYNAPVEFLKKAINSVRNQAYQNWELCIADDCSTDKKVQQLLRDYLQKDDRVKVVFREVNGHISQASNSALAIAGGDFIVLLDQDDELPVHSLYMVAEALNKNRDLAIIYSDEDKIDEYGNRFDPYFKTDWNKELFYGQNMISHLGVYKRSLVEKIGGFRKGYEGSQDYDLALRCIELVRPEQVHHIPHILYHWRALQGSTAVNVSNKNYAVDAGLRALQDHFDRTREQAIAEINTNNTYRVRWSLPADKPTVSIIIPNKDKVDVLTNCITSIFNNTTYPNIEVLIVDNNSYEPATLAYYKEIKKKHKQLRILEFKKAFNFSAMNNLGAAHAKGEILLLLNNDTVVINNDWLCEMVSLCLRKDTGAVGAKLFYPNGQIQHAGVFLHAGHPGNHIYLKREKDDPGYFNKLNLVQNYLAVTAACLAVRKEVYLEAGGLDEEHLAVAYNDVDFCLKLVQLGYKNIWTPFAKLIHCESLSRGNDFDETNYARFQKEHAYVLEKWGAIVANDPFFNHNLGVDTRTTQFAFPPAIAYEWEQEVMAEQVLAGA